MHQDLAFLRRPDTEDRLRELGAAGPDEPGETYNLTAPQREVNAFELAGPPQTTHFERHLAGVVGVPAEQLVEGRPTMRRTSSSASSAEAARSRCGAHRAAR